MAAEIQQILEELRAIRAEMATDKREVIGKLDEIAQIKSSLVDLQGKVSALEQENMMLREEIRINRVQSNVNEQLTKASNLLLFGVPGKTEETRAETEALVRRLLAKTEVPFKLTCAQRMNRKVAKSPIVATFESKLHAQEAFHQIRMTGNLTSDMIGMDGNSRIDVRFHLSKHLTQLLRSASLLKREMGWQKCRPYSDSQTVELRKDETSATHVFHTMEELVTFKNQLIDTNVLPPTSPAANIGQRPIRAARKRTESKAAIDSNFSRHSKRQNQMN